MPTLLGNRCGAVFRITKKLVAFFSRNMTSRKWGNEITRQQRSRRLIAETEIKIGNKFKQWEKSGDFRQTGGRASASTKKISKSVRRMLYVYVYVMLLICMLIICEDKTMGM